MLRVAERCAAAARVHTSWSIALINALPPPAAPTGTLTAVRFERRALRPQDIRIQVCGLSDSMMQFCTGHVLGGAAQSDSAAGECRQHHAAGIVIKAGSLVPWLPPLTDCLRGHLPLGWAGVGFEAAWLGGKWPHPSAYCVVCIRNAVGAGRCRPQCPASMPSTFGVPHSCRHPSLQTCTRSATSGVRQHATRASQVSLAGVEASVRACRGQPAVLQQGCPAGSQTPPPAAHAHAPGSHVQLFTMLPDALQATRLWALSQRQGIAGQCLTPQACMHLHAQRAPTDCFASCFAACPVISSRSCDPSCHCPLIVSQIGSSVGKFKVGDRAAVGCMVGSCGR